MQINFTAGFTIITGETGAGKSILLGALNLLLGERADANMLKDSTQKCILEGTFAMPIKTSMLHNLFQELDIDIENEITIRREITTNGKSRAFVNDTPVNLTQLRQISSLLVDLHQQFDTLELNEESFQREVIDSIANTTTMLQEYKVGYKKYNLLLKEITQLKEEQLQATKTLDYNKFLYNELDEANLRPGELEELEEELKLLNNAESIKTSLQQASDGLVNADVPIVQQLKQLVNVLKSSANLQQSILTIQQRLQASIIELDDIAAEIETINDSIVFDAERIEAINEKINIGYKLLKKHNVQTTNQLLQIKQTLEAEIVQVASGDQIILQKEKEAETLFKGATKLAEEIHTKRESVAKPFAQKVNALLHKVGMPNAQIQIAIKQTELNVYGNSSIAFLFDANKSGKLEPIHKVASGGELSRLMLCIKSLVAGAMQLPVLIFDEIDTGISGEAARQVGIIMSDLAKQHQIICITHQAQIAAKANNHYFVYKSIENNNVSTSIKTLTMDERITTIAQMLSGEKPTAAAMQNAREMVGN